MSAVAYSWICGDDTGISSKRIWAQMMGVASSVHRGIDGDYPLDPDDFGRCYRLLRLIPEWRPRIGEMAYVHPVWAGLADAWDELEAMYEEEVETRFSRHRGCAPRLYARMKEIENAARPSTARKSA